MKDLIEFIKNETKGEIQKCFIPNQVTYEIKKENFHEFNINKCEKIFAVDGGNATIIDGGGWLISKIRVGYVKMNSEKTVEQEINEHYAALIAKGNEVLVKTAPEKNKIKIEKIEDGVNKIRRYLELKLAYKLAKENKDSLVLIDGTLENNSLNFPENIIGVSKTSRLRTNTGRSLIGYLNQISKEIKNPWYYYPIFDSEIKTYIVKFHPASRFCYRVDLSKENPEIFSKISYFCQDPEMIGYPYPLLKVDKLVRINNEEVKMEKQKIKIANENITNDEISTIMHDLLDERAYR